MAIWNDILKAKLETLLGERGSGTGAAVRRREIDGLLSKAATVAAARAETAANARVAEALKIAKRAEAAVEALRSTQAEVVADAADETTDNERLSDAVASLFQWNGGTYALRVPATGITGKVLEDQIADEAISIAKFAAGLRPVELLASLPTTGNFDGRHVYRTSDKSLWRHNGTAWVNTNSTDLLVGKIVAGQIEVGAVGAQELAADAVTVRSLAVSNFSNLILNSELTSSDGWTLTGGAAFLDTPPSNASAPGNFTTPPITSGEAMARWFGGASRRLPVRPGEEYFISADFRASGTTPNFRTRIIVWMYDRAGAYVGAYVGAIETLTNTVYNNKSLVWAVPAGVAYCEIGFGRTGDSSASGTGYIENPTVRRRNDGKLIVDGAFGANHVDTGSFSASGLALFGGELKSSNFVQGSSGWRIRNTGEAELESLVVRTRHLEAGAVSADWNSYTSGWVPLSYGALLDVQTLTINDPTVAGRPAWVTFSCQVGMTRSTAGRGRGEFWMNLSDGAGTQAFGYWEINQYLPASVEMQLPITMTRRVVLTGGTATITINAGNLDCDTFRFRNRRIEVNVMKR